MPWVWTDELAARLDGADVDPARLHDWRTRPIAVPVEAFPETTDELLALRRVVDLLGEETG